MSCGYTCLAQNPLAPEKFVSSSQIIDDADVGINLWEVNPEVWATQVDTNAKAMGNKRARTSIPQMQPIASMRCAGGVQSMSWASATSLIAGCTDH